jgi:tetratricopeptide (TPR) repeat protein
MNQNNDQLEEKTANDKPEEELESSFRSSYRQTYTNLKTYWGGEQQAADSSSDDGWASTTRAGGSPNALNAALSGSSPSNKIVTHEPAPTGPSANPNVQSHPEQSSFRQKPTPPAGTHAPHHPWHLGGGGKRKPPGLKQKLPDNEPVPMFGEELKAAGATNAGSTNGMPPPAEGEVRHLGGRGIPYSVDGANGQANLDVLKKIAARPSASPPPQPHFGSSEPITPCSPETQPLSSEGPHIVTPGAPPVPVPPQEQPLLGEHEDLEQGTDLYAPTVEVITPPIAKEEFNDQPYDESVAHLYMPTADVAKPVIAQNQMLNPSEPSSSEHFGGATEGSHPAGPSLPKLPKNNSFTSDPNLIQKPVNLPPPSTVPSEDALKAEQWENVPRSKRPKLNSYIDRQLAKDGIDHVEPSLEGDDQQELRKRSSSPSRGILLGGIVVAALALTGFLIVAVTRGGGLPMISNDSWKPLAEQADTAIADGKYADAIATLDEAIKLNPNVPALFHKRGLAKLESHNRQSYDSALQDLNVAINEDANLLEAVLDRAAVRIELGQFQGAIDDYDALIKAGKDTDKVHYGRGLAKYYAGDYNEAQSEFEKILDNDSSNVPATIALGTTLYKGQSDIAAADKKFADAAASDATGLALRNRAILAYRQGSAGYETAHKFYSDAIEKNPGDANLYNERGIVHWMQKDPLGATSDFKAAVERDPSLESAKSNLSQVSKSTALGGNDAVLKLLDGDWKGSATAADKLFADPNLSKADSVRLILTKWVATHYQNRDVLAGEVLRTAQKPASSDPWQSTLVKYLVNRIDFETAQKSAQTQSQKTDLNYYGAIKDIFDLKRPEDGSKKLKWVLDKGLTTSPEYALAKRSLKWLKEEQGETEE